MIIKTDCGEEIWTKSAVDKALQEERESALFWIGDQINDMADKYAEKGDIKGFVNALLTGYFKYESWEKKCARIKTTKSKE